MTGSRSRHLGLDLGGTNLKWAVVEQSDGTWRTLDRGEVPTTAQDGPPSVVSRMARTAAEAITAWEGTESVGIGVPGLYDPATGETRFLVNVPGEWAGRPVAAPVSQAVGLPVALINDARAFGLAELRLGAGRGAQSMVGLTLGTGVGGVIAIGGQVVQGHDGTAGAAVRAARAGDARALAGLREIARHLGVGIANMIVVISPDRVVIGGGLAAAGELLLEPIREELRRRVKVTDLDRVSLVVAELGTWAGAIGAAVHGAEQGAAAVAGARPGTVG